MTKRGLKVERRMVLLRKETLETDEERRLVRNLVGQGWGGWDPSAETACAPRSTSVTERQADTSLRWSAVGSQGRFGHRAPKALRVGSKPGWTSLSQPNAQPAMEGCPQASLTSPTCLMASFLQCLPPTQSLLSM